MAVMLPGFVMLCVFTWHFLGGFCFTGSRGETQVWGLGVDQI
jgi:hypothetical protein